MSTPQKAILLPVPRLARYATFSLAPNSDARASLRKLRTLIDGERTVAGIGESLVSALGRKIDGLRGLPQFATHGLDIPSTPAALWLWMRGDDRGELMHRSRHLAAELAPALQLDGVIDANAFERLKQIQSSRGNSVILHELYFDGLALKATTPPEAVKKAIDKRFGSVDKWTADIVASAKAAAGWAMLVVHPVNGKLYMLGGAWDRLQVGDFSQPVGFGIAAGVIVPWSRTNEDHPLRIYIEDDDARKLPLEFEVNVNVGRPPNAVRGQSFRALLALNGAWQFPGPGSYRVVADLVGDEPRRAVFYVTAAG